MHFALQALTEAFITVFGITRPRPGEEARTGLYIALLLALLAGALAALTYGLLLLW
jgi:hypothetical protein